MTHERWRASKRYRQPRFTSRYVLLSQAVKNEPQDLTGDQQQQQQQQQQPPRQARTPENNNSNDLQR